MKFDGNDYSEYVLLMYTRHRRKSVKNSKGGHAKCPRQSYISSDIGIFAVDYKYVDCCKK